MKSFIKPVLTSACAAAATFTLAIAPLGAAEITTSATTTTATTSSGTIAETIPGSNTIVVRTTETAVPTRYAYTTSTEYVDEAGAPVSLEVVRSGLPVTVNYVREGDRLVARRVIVRKSVAVPTAAFSDTPTSTVTTTEVAPTTAVVTAPAPVIASQTTTTTTTTGEIAEMGSNHFMVRTETGTPASYQFSKTTTYVDETGARVSLDVVRSGLPVTVHYTRSGDQLVANRVIVRRAISGRPTAIVEKETTRRATITEEPVRVEKQTRIREEAPVRVEKKTTTVAPAAEPVIEKKTKTTTTTTKKGDDDDDD